MKNSQSTEVDVTVRNFTECQNCGFAWWDKEEVFCPKCSFSTETAVVTASIITYKQGGKEIGRDFVKSCQKSCGPGDHRPGGKCDQNGCYE